MYTPLQKMFKYKVFAIFYASLIFPVFGQKSMDQVDRESFKVESTPFVEKGIGMYLSDGDPVEFFEAGVDLLLDGEWQLAEGGAEKMRLNDSWNQAIAAIVPGSVHTALWKAGIIPNPYFGMNDSIAEKQSYKTWWYKKDFVVSEKIKAPLLDFGGIANKCTVWLNGVKLGSHEGMFGGPTFDISKILKQKNTLIVKLDPIPQIFEPQGTFFGGANKSWQNTVVFNCVYGWHYSKIPSLGIWRSVRIINQAPVEIENPFIRTKNVKGDMQLSLKLRSIGASLKGKLVVGVSPDNFEGKTQSFEYNLNSAKKAESVQFDFSVANPKLWWPNDMGEQNLYKLRVGFIPAGGLKADVCETTFGIRTIEMQPLPQGPKQDTYNWTFVVNGKPMFVKGAGWCTMDPLMDFSKERYDRFLSLAKQQHIQMLRAWGGGMPETDDFYQLCDRYGIMVIQEWPTAWNSHNTQPFDILKETVERNTLRLRNHPALVMWGAGNESDKPTGPAIDMMGRLSIELDGTRPFHRGEAWGGSKHDYTCWWDEAHLNHNLNMTASFWGEFGIASFPQKESVMRYLPENEKNNWPPKKGESLLHHMPIFGTVGEMRRLEQYGGYLMPLESLDNLIIGSQIAQIVGVRHTLERARTRWPECTGALYYKMNDNYPAVSWSCVDWYGAVKPLHYFVQNSFAPLASVILFGQTNMSSQQVSLPVFLLDDTDKLINKEWQVNIACYNDQLKKVAEKQFEGKSGVNKVLNVGSIDLTPEQTRSSVLWFVSEVKSGSELLFRTFYFMNFEVRKGSLFKCPQTTLTSDKQGNKISITNIGQFPAIGVNVQSPGNEDKLNCSENYIWLQPGETKIIDVGSTHSVLVKGWNIKEAISN